MSKRKTTSSDGMRREYDFAKGVRGKYIGRVPARATTVTLDVDVARVFHDDKSVNEALRALIAIVRPRVPRRRK